MLKFKSRSVVFNAGLIASIEHREWRTPRSPRQEHLVDAETRDPPVVLEHRVLRID